MHMLVYFLTGASYKETLADYLATEMDTNKHKFDIFYNLIQKENGIEKYLISCNLTELELNQFKEKLMS